MSAREFVGDDGHDWHVVRFPSEACGANYADVARVDGTKTSVRQAEVLRRSGLELVAEEEEERGVCMNCGDDMDYDPSHPWCAKCDEDDE